jgi:hypothetical protein
VLPALVQIAVAILSASSEPVPKPLKHHLQPSRVLGFSAAPASNLPDDHIHVLAAKFGNLFRSVLTLDSSDKQSSVQTASSMSLLGACGSVLILHSAKIL